MNRQKNTLFKNAFLFCALAMTHILSAQNEDSKLLDDYVKTRGNGIIVFDAGNIKQFWVDNSVIGRDDYIEILLSNDAQRQTIPLRFQLINVNETQDCKIEVVTDNPNASFTVVDEKSKKLSESKQENDFLKYHVLSSVFHLENTQNTAFSLVFSNRDSDVLSVRKIVLSFQNNPNSSFLASPGVLSFKKDLLDIDKGSINDISDTAFVVTGQSTSELTSIKSVFIKNYSFDMSIKLKNTGNNPISIFAGYKVFDSKKKVLYKENYPFNGTNKILTVLESQANSDYIIVDAVPEWEKQCYLAVNAKDDLSDIPSTSFANGRILDVQELEGGHAKIIFEKAQQNALPKGAKVRVHGHGGGYLYMNSKKIQPSEEIEYKSTIQRDDSKLIISKTAFPLGSYSVKPVIILVPEKKNEDFSVEISDFSVSF